MENIAPSSSSSSVSCSHRGIICDPHSRPPLVNMEAPRIVHTRDLYWGYLNISYASFGGLNSLRSALAFFVWSTVSTLGNLRTTSFLGTDATTRLLMLTNSVGLEKHRQRDAAMKMAMRCSVSSSTC